MASSTQFKDKVIAITGAASGIGLETARLLASRGALLSLADVQAEALQKVQAELKSAYGTDALVKVTDVRHYDQVDAWIKDTVAKFGRLDGAANLAGVIPKSLGNKTLAEEELADWEFVVGVNLTGVMYCMRAQLGAMADGGAMVNASSIAGTTGRAMNSSYSASKHGVLGLTRSAAKEVGVRGIRVNAICPGRIETPMVAKARTLESQETREASEKEGNSEVALRRNGQPEEVAKLIAFLLSDEASYMTGTDIAIDGGWRC